MRTVQAKPTVSISQMLERIMSSGQLSRREYLQLTSALLSDDKLTEEERHKINRIFDYIQISRLKFVD